jgi:hypothetical protein
VLLGLVITASEYYYNIKNMKFLWPLKYTDDPTRHIRNYIPDNVYENLSNITWDVSDNNNNNNNFITIFNLTVHL